jgi:hypothetical protein
MVALTLLPWMAVLPLTQALAQDGPGGEDLSARAADPLAALMSLQFSDRYTASFHEIDDESPNQFVFRSALPFTFGKFRNVFRIIRPFAASTPSDNAGIVGSTTLLLRTSHHSRIPVGSLAQGTGSPLMWREKGARRKA